MFASSLYSPFHPNTVDIRTAFRDNPLRATPDAPSFNLVVKDGPRGVDLRELHRDLGSKQDFTTWTKAKLKDFVKGYDYEEVFHNSVKNSGGRPRKDWTVSIECAKHIAMMEQTYRGRHVRQYFIDFEEADRAKEAVAAPAPMALPTYPEALRALADALEPIETGQVTSESGFRDSLTSP